MLTHGLHCKLNGGVLIGMLRADDCHEFVNPIETAMHCGLQRTKVYRYRRRPALTQSDLKPLWCRGLHRRLRESVLPDSLGSVGVGVSAEVFGLSERHKPAPDF